MDFKLRRDADVDRALEAGHGARSDREAKELKAALDKGKKRDADCIAEK